MPALKASRRAPTSDEELTRMRGVVREGAQDRPGIYRMLSPDGEVVYVGKSKRVRTRLLSYFRCAYPEDKGARILREATTIDWEYTPERVRRAADRAATDQATATSVQRRDET